MAGAFVMSLISGLLTVYLKSGLRGSTRLTNFFAKRLKSLQALPVKVDGGTVILDLRIGSAHGILAGAADHTGEGAVIRSLVREGDVVYDIGAHFGLYTVLFSSLVGETGAVFAFEPNPEVLSSINKTVKTTPNVNLFEVALSDREGTASLFVPEDASMASLSDWTDGVGGKVETVLCEQIRLDDLMAREGDAIPLPEFVKCDVEGAEMLVFGGASKVFDRIDAPTVLFEVNAKAAKKFGNIPADYFGFFRSLEFADYSVFEVTRRGVKPLRGTEMAYGNMIAIPASKLESIPANFVNYEPDGIGGHSEL